MPDDKAGITVQQLLNHTSGLPHALNQGAVPTEALTHDQTLTAILEAPLRFDPGTGDLYSNPGYTLLAILAELESGKPFGTYIREQFLDPIGMTSTFFGGEDVEGLPEASYTNAYNRYGKASEWPDSWKLQGAGTLLSTVDDLYRFHQAVLTDPFISSVIPSRGGLGEADGSTGWTGRARLSGGSGIGLMIARMLVEAQGGRIWAESEGLGLGCVFHFTLPLTHFHHESTSSTPRTRQLLTTKTRQNFTLPSTDLRYNNVSRA